MSCPATSILGVNCPYPLITFLTIPLFEWGLCALDILDLLEPKDIIATCLTIKQGVPVSSLLDDCLEALSKATKCQWMASH